MEYKYKGINGAGKIVKGKIFEGSQYSAINKLNNQGISCIYCEARANWKEELIPKRISYKELILLCRTLKNNLKSGIPITTSLKLAVKYMKKHRFAAEMSNLLLSIEKGETFTEALNQCGSFFPKIFVSMVSIGEESGKLEEVFARMEVYFTNEYKRRRVIKNIMIYPVVIFIVASIGAFVIITKFMPNFFSNMRVDKNQVPGITKFYMTVAEFFTKFNFLILPLLLVISFIFGFIYKKSVQLGYLDRLKYKNIILKDIYGKNFSCRFTMALHMIISCGMDIKNAFHLLKKSETSDFIKERYKVAMDELEKGNVLSDAIKSFQLFPEEFLVSILLGEESGDLEGVLLRYNEIFEEDLKSRIDLFTKMLEPALILLAGLFLLSIYAAILLPIYSIYSS